jgi:hypothetical protein
VYVSILYALYLQFPLTAVLDLLGKSLGAAYERKRSRDAQGSISDSGAGWGGAGQRKRDIERGGERNKSLTFSCV